jgi:hypothetical protein
MLYIIINKETNEIQAYKDKTQLSEVIGLHRNTISRRLEKSPHIETKKYKVYTLTNINNSERGKFSTFTK